VARTDTDAVYVGLVGVLDTTLVTTDAGLATAPGPRAQIDVVATG
jgi:predicted nucleic acid-binding protein